MCVSVCLCWRRQWGDVAVGFGVGVYLLLCVFVCVYTNQCDAAWTLAVTLRMFNSLNVLFITLIITFAAQRLSA